MLSAVNRFRSISDKYLAPSLVTKQPAALLYKRSLWYTNIVRFLFHILEYRATAAPKRHNRKDNFVVLEGLEFNFLITISCPTSTPCHTWLDEQAKCSGSPVWTSLSPSPSSYSSYSSAWRLYTCDIIRHKVRQIMSLDTDGKHSAASIATFLTKIAGSTNPYRSSSQRNPSITGSYRC
jgi:hypothetical protein